MRVRFQAALRTGWAVRGGIRKPAAAPPGYTAHTAVTEWLTLNCAGAWAAQNRHSWIEVHFNLKADAEFARAHFAPLGLWR